jgi:hypothetical protein
MLRAADRRGDVDPLGLAPAAAADDGNFGARVGLLAEDEDEDEEGEPPPPPPPLPPPPPVVVEEDDEAAEEEEEGDADDDVGEVIGDEVKPEEGDVAAPAEAAGVACGLVEEDADDGFGVADAIGGALEYDDVVDGRWLRDIAGMTATATKILTGSRATAHARPAFRGSRARAHVLTHTAATPHAAAGEEA